VRSFERVDEPSVFTLSSVVPWGRSFDEYRRMFALTDADLSRRILGCGDGPAGFNAEAARRGGRIVSCDPLYQFDAAQIRQRIDATSAEVLEQARQNAHEFVWDAAIPDVEALKRVRMAAMTAFLDDYEAGRREGRYVVAGLPALPFADGAFDVALCSHFLFLYSRQHDSAFHVHSMRELCRVAREARVFPLLALGGQPSPHVAPVTAELEALGFTVTIERVPYEFQRGANEMLRVTS
jgi:SAM-dependent methyltransferase